MNKPTMIANSVDLNPGVAVPQAHTGGLARWTSQVLFAGMREVIIEHAGVEYRLRLTSQDKLILTK